MLLKFVCKDYKMFSLFDWDDDVSDDVLCSQMAAIEKKREEDELERIILESERKWRKKNAAKFYRDHSRAFRQRCAIINAEKWAKILPREPPLPKFINKNALLEFPRDTRGYNILLAFNASRIYNVSSQFVRET